MFIKRIGMVAVLAGGLPMILSAQQTTPASPGQAAFGAIAEVVRVLKMDQSTDWSRVDIEALRQHLIDMDEVTMRAAVTHRKLPDGVEIDVTGTGRTLAAIQRVLASHAAMLEHEPDYRSAAQQTANGIRFTVTARNPSDARVVLRIQGLGFAGLLTEANHHASHHVALARGAPMAHGR